MKFSGANENKIVLKKSHKYLSDTKLKSLPAGRIDKQYTGIGATTFEINDRTRNSIIVCPTVALASSKAFAAQQKFQSDTHTKIFYLGSNVGAILRLPDPVELRSLLVQGIRIKILAVIDSFVQSFDGEYGSFIQDFHLLIDEADTLQLDSVFRSIMEDCLELYFKFPSARRTMISATMLGSQILKLRKEPLTTIEKIGMIKPTIRIKKVKGYLPYSVGRTIKETLYKARGTKIVVAANSFELIHEILVAVRIDLTDVKILCSEGSKERAGRLFARLDRGQLPSEAKIVFITSAYFVGVDIYDPFILFVASDTGKKHRSSLLSAEQVFQIYGRARNHGCSSVYYYFNTFKTKTKVRTRDEMKHKPKASMRALISCR